MINDAISEIRTWVLFSGKVKLFRFPQLRGGTSGVSGYPDWCLSPGGESFMRGFLRLVVFFLYLTAKFTIVLLY